MQPRFPTTRLRRLRHNPLMRDLMRETTLTVHDLVLPLFVRPGRGVRKEIASMPGNYQLSPDTLIEEVGGAVDLGLRASLSSAIPANTDASGTSARIHDANALEPLRCLSHCYGERIYPLRDECSFD